MTQPNKTLVEAIRLARFDPSKFARDVLQLKRLNGEPSPGEQGYNPDTDWQLDAWQEEIIESVADVDRKRLGIPTKYNHVGKQYITCVACQGPGKTFGIALLAHIWGFAYDPLVITTVAPKLEHIKTRFFGEFEKIRGRAIPGYKELMEVGAQQIKWKTSQPINHFLQAETGAQPENVQGLRRRFMITLIDEAAGMSPKMMPVLFGNMNAAELAVLVMIGNGNRLSGDFADSHLKASLAPLYYRMQIGPEKSRRVKRKDVERLELQYGRDSDITRVRAYGMFPKGDSNQLIALEWLESARIRESNSDGSIPRLRITVDVADGGTAETVCSGALHYAAKVVFLKESRHSFPSHVAPIYAANAALEMYIALGGDPTRGDDIVVDANGVGAGTAGSLMTRDDAVINGVRIPIVPYRGGHASANPKLYRNMRVQSHLVMRNRYRDGLIAYADDYTDDWDGLFGQLCMNRKKVGLTGDRVEDLLSKEELVELGFISPDRSDAQSMHFVNYVPTLAIAQAHAPASDNQVTVIESTVLEGFF